jgi:BTB/POZ domain
MVRFKVSGPRQSLNGAISYEDFNLFRQFIYYHSPVFQRAIEKDNLQCVEVDDTDPKAFSLFVRWIYTQDISTGGKEWLPCAELVELWMLADFAQIPTLQDCALKALEDLSNSRNQLPVEMFERVWRKTKKGSTLRTYMINALIEEERVDRQGYPREVLEELFGVLVEKKAVKDGGFVWKADAPALISSDQMFFPI